MNFNWRKQPCSPVLRANCAEASAKHVQRTSQKRAATPQARVLNFNMHAMTGSKRQWHAHFLKIRPHPGADAGGNSLHQLRYAGHRKGAGDMQILLRVDGLCYRRCSPVLRFKQGQRCVLPMSRDSKQNNNAVHAQLAIAEPWYTFLLPTATCARRNGAIFASGEGSKSTPPPYPAARNVRRAQAGYS